MIKLKKNIILKDDVLNLQDFSNDIADLFSSINWTYSDKLINSFKSSTHIVYAFDNNKLIGIARSMDDGLWQANVDTVIVHKNYQNQGIGSELIKHLLDLIKDVEYINICANDPIIIKFYKLFGFEDIGGVFLQKHNI